jgi:immune inhibitor A
MKQIRWLPCLSAVVLGCTSLPASAIPPFPPGQWQPGGKTDAARQASLERIAAHQGTTLPGPVHASGIVRLPVILIDFDDEPADRTLSTPAYYDSLLFGKSAANRPSLRDFFLENSFGALEVRGTVTPWVRSRFLYHGYYANADAVDGTGDDNGFDTSASAASGTDYPRNVWGLVKEAVELADPYLDFPEFDNDQDGTVDAVIVVHAGCGAEFQSCRPTADHIWSHQSALGDYFEPRVPRLWPVEVDGVRVDVYTMNPEDGELGVFCHELGHTLGLPDLYNTTSLVSRVGRFCLMDYGGWSGWPVGRVPSHMSAWCKSFLGWLVPEALDSSTDPGLEPRSVLAPPIEEAPWACRILDNPDGVDWRPGHTGQGEYFLVENRQLLGFDSDLFTSAGATGEGLLILHVDESQPDNDGAARLLVSVVQADGGGLGDLGTGQASDLWRPGMEFSPWSEPSSDLYDGAFTGVSVTHIEDAGDDRISASLSRGEILPGPEMYVFPNPWVLEDGSDERMTITFADPEADDAEVRRLKVRIYDLAGNLVRTLDDPSESPTTGSRAYWDGRNEGGETVAGGLYFLRADDGVQERTGKVAVVR